MPHYNNKFDNNKNFIVGGGGGKGGREGEPRRVVQEKLKWPFTISEKLEAALMATSFHHFY